MERPVATLKLNIGEKAPYFSLRGTDNKMHTLKDFQGAPALVAIFTCNHCPYARAYESRLVEIASSYRPRGVQFVSFCANDAERYPEDSFEKMCEKSEEMGQPYPYLHDEEQIVARAYDAACTPEIYVFDAEQRLAYHGAIDDNHKDPAAVSEHYLRDALDALLAGEAVPTPMTGCIGCSIKWKP